MCKLALLKRGNIPFLVALILAGGVLLRLRDVTSPPIEMHSWRQTETAALARNYKEEGYRLLYPTIDWRGNTPGYVESELSIYAFTAALAYGLFGASETVARLVSIIAWTLTALLLFLVGRRAFGARIALWTLIFFAFISPFSIFMGRTIMGDMTAQLFVLLAVYGIQRWQAEDKIGWFALGMVGAACAGLCKLPSLYIGVPLAVMVLQHDGRRALTRPRNWVGAAVVLGIVGGWYIHAYQMGQQTGLTFAIIAKSNEKVGNLQLATDPGFYVGLLYNFTWRLLTTVGTILTVAGILAPRRSHFEFPMLAWVLAALSYFVYAAPGVQVQDYYTLALLPPAALFIGKAVDFILTLIAAWWKRGMLPLRLAAAALVLVGLLALAFTANETHASVDDMFAPRESIAEERLAGQWADAVVPPATRIIAVGAGQPEGLYFAHRHGLWFDGEGREYVLFDLDKLARQKWKYLVVFNPYWSEINVPWLQLVQSSRKLIGGGPWFLAYDITQKPTTTPAHAFTPPPTWGKQQSLLGYELAPDRTVNGRVYLVLYWRAERRMNRQYKGFMHLADANGKPCGQDDHVPLEGRYGQELWDKGQVVGDAFQVDLSACPGIQHLVAEVGLYRAEDGGRLALPPGVGQGDAYRFAIDVKP